MVSVCPQTCAMYGSRDAQCWHTFRSTQMEGGKQWTSTVCWTGCVDGKVKSCDHCAEAKPTINSRREACFHLGRPFCSTALHEAPRLGGGVGFKSEARCECIRCIGVTLGLSILWNPPSHLKEAQHSLGWLYLVGLWGGNSTLFFPQI